MNHRRPIASRPRERSGAFLALALGLLSAGCGFNWTVTSNDPGGAGGGPDHTSPTGGTSTGEGGSGGSGGAPDGSTASASTSSASTSASTSASSSSASTGSGVAPGCDAHKSCGSCVSCAQKGPCAALSAVCTNDPDCAGLMLCFATCFDGACLDDCVYQYPDGAQEFFDAIACVICDTCSGQCPVANGILECGP